MSEYLDEDPDETVRALLRLSGVTPSEAEVVAMAAGFASTRAMVETLHQMPGVRYQEPAVIFDARP